VPCQYQAIINQMIVEMLHFLGIGFQYYSLEGWAAENPPGGEIEETPIF
jgi:hypothetical protein